MQEHILRLPDLELPNSTVKVIAWLAQTGDRVMEGDRLVELLAGEVAIELDSPITGMLMEQRKLVDQTVSPGDILAILRTH